MRASAEAGFSTATDLADWLVREADVPFREAHHITGRAVALAEQKGCGLDGLTIEDFKAIDPRLDSRVHKVLSVEASVRKPQELWRHGSGQCPGPGGALAGAARRVGARRLPPLQCSPGLAPGPRSCHVLMESKRMT